MQQHDLICYVWALEHASLRKHNIHFTLHVCTCTLRVNPYMCIHVHIVQAIVIVQCMHMIPRVYLASLPN